MRFPFSIRVGRTTAAVGTLLALAAVAATALATEGAARAGGVSAGRADSHGGGQSPTWGELQLGLAVHGWWRGEPGEAARHLRMALAPGSYGDLSPADRERAAFLLAVASVRLGETEGLEQASSALAGRPPETALGAWVARLAVGAGGPIDLADLRRQEEALLAGGTVPRPLSLYLQAITRELAGGDADETWEELSNTAGANRFEDDLIALASIRLAGGAWEADRDPNVYLSRVPDRSRFAPRAGLMEATSLKERVNRVEAAARLEAVLDGAPEGPLRFDAALALAAIDFEGGRWAEAATRLGRLEESWTAEREKLASIRAGADRDSLWEAWSASIRASGDITLDAAADRAAAAAFAGKAADRRVARVEAEPPEPSFAIEAAGDRAAPAPGSATREELARLDTLDNRIERCDGAIRAVRAEVRDRREQGERDAVYFARGTALAGESAGILAAASGEADSLHRNLEAALARLDGVSEEAKRRVAMRTRAVIARAERDARIAGAIEFLYLDHPAAGSGASGRNDSLAREVVRTDRALAGELRAWSGRFATETPLLVDRSRDEIWAPGLSEGVARVRERSASLADRAGAIGDAIGAALGAAAEKRWFAAAADSIESLARRREKLAAERTTTRNAVLDRILRDAAGRLVAKGEGLCYMLALATGELAASESDPDGNAAPDAAAGRRRAEAIDRFQAFLDDYPDSPARPEIRFRLADHLAFRAAERHRREMEAYLARPDDTFAEVPVIDFRPSLKLHLAILREDPGYAGLDAVLFSAGSLLLDAGDDRGARHLRALLEEHADSPFRPDGALRLGDWHFGRSEYDDALRCFDVAARSGDEEVATVALYKTGWAHFNREEYGPAARAFREVLVRAPRAAADSTARLEEEAKEYLVHSLARAGGISAYLSLFPTAGDDLFEEEVLSSLCSLLRRFSQYGDAARGESIRLDRFPDRPGALDAARRLVQTYEKWNRVEEALRKGVELADLFREGGPWYEANESDSLREEAEAFAAGAYRSAGLFHHRAARESGDRESWEKALRLYETAIERFGDRGGVDELHHYAGDAAAALGRFGAAVAHFDEAALSDSAALAEEAEWQAAAVLDRWYVSTAGDEERGDDSLALRLIAASDRYTEHHPDRARSADLLWRKGTLAYDFEWFDRAEEGLRLFTERFGDDPRAVEAARLGAAARYDLGSFGEAADRFAWAADFARRSGADSAAAAMEEMVPVCRFREAEERAEADSAHPAEAARLFEHLALRTPGAELAPLSLYRAGDAYLAAGETDGAVRCLRRLAADHRESEWASEAQLRIAATWEEQGRPADAASALERFWRLFPDDESAPGALLKGAALYEEEGDLYGARSLRDLYLEHYPGDVETAETLLRERAMAELEHVAPDRPLAAIAADSASALSRYRALAREHPELADRAVEARVLFLAGEADFRAFRSTPPDGEVEDRIVRGKEALEKLIERYGACASLGIEPWNRAAACRTGEALVLFGDRIAESPPPAGLAGADADAYRGVLVEQGDRFRRAGEQALADLLRNAGPTGVEADVVAAGATTGEWIARAREILWPRMARRFLHMPEMAFPLVRGVAPEGDERIASREGRMEKAPLGTTWSLRLQ